MMRDANNAGKRYNKPANGKNVKKSVKTVKKVAHAVPQSPEELQNVIKIVKYNANIKRHTSLNILKTFVEDGFIDEAKGAFVEFMWDKYTVKSKGVVKEYAYDKTFIEALVKAHSDMAADSTNAIAAFIKFANID